MQELIRMLIDKLRNDEFREQGCEYIREARSKSEVLEYHFEDEYPEKLLKHNHPSEEVWMKEYRKRRWQSPTKVFTGRVYQFLQKIQQADDFKIQWETEFGKTGIAEKVGGNENTLKHYCQKEIPLYKDLENWLFNVFLKSYLADPNSVVAILPDIYEWIEKPNEVLELDWSKPFPQTFETEDLLYECSEYVLVEVEEWKDSNKKKWKQYLAITLEGLILLRQFQPFKEPQPFKIFTIPYLFEYLPVVKTGNVIYEVEDGKLVYDSVLEPCLPAWNEVLYRSDDLNILYAVHALPQKWALKLSPCKTCNGIGNIVNSKHERVDCRECNGSGRASATPFSLLEINIDKISAINPQPLVPPIPPAGYIERPTDAVKLFQEDILHKEYQGFKAIGLEILGQVPAAQSGVAKEYDRKELNTFCYSVCVHLVEVFKYTTYHIMFQRYNSLFQSGMMSDEKVMNSLPKITVPTDYDVLTSAVVGGMLAMAKQSNFSPMIVQGIEQDYIEKLYGENSPQKKYLKALNTLDPLPFKSADEKGLLMQSGGCSKLDYVLSANIAGFITELIEQDKDWIDKPASEQRKDVKAMAEEKLKEINASLVPLMPEGM